MCSKNAQSYFQSWEAVYGTVLLYGLLINITGCITDDETDIRNELF